jgi:adenylate cyclase
VRIAIRLVDANSGEDRWAERFDRPSQAIFAVQDEIVEKVAKTVGLLLKLEEMRLPHIHSFRPTDNIEAFDDFLLAQQYFFQFTKEANDKAEVLLKDAIALDPKFAPAYAFLGWSYWTAAAFGWKSSDQAHFQALDLCRELANRALALDDSYSHALGLLAAIEDFQRQYDQAIADAERNVTLNPNAADAYMRLGYALIVADRPMQGISATVKAMRLDPASADTYEDELGVAYLVMLRFQEAITHLNKFVVHYPANFLGHIWLAIAYTEVGRNKEAREEAAKVMRVGPHFRLPRAEQGVFKNVRLNKRFGADFNKAAGIG